MMCIHTECLREDLLRNFRVECSVCRQPYTYTRTVHRHHFFKRLWRALNETVTFTVTITGAIAFALVVLAALLENLPVQGTYLTLPGALIILISAFFLYTRIISQHKTTVSLRLHKATASAGDGAAVTKRDGIPPELKAGKVILTIEYTQPIDNRMLPGGRARLRELEAAMAQREREIRAGVWDEPPPQVEEGGAVASDYAALATAGAPLPSDLATTGATSRADEGVGDEREGVDAAEERV